MHEPLDMRVGPIPPNGSDPNGESAAPPGALPTDLPGPLDPLSVERMNMVSLATRQGLKDRLEAESRGHDSVFSQ